MHYYEAMQVFAHIFGMPEIHTGWDPGDGGNGPDSLLRVTSDGGAEKDLPLFIEEARRNAYSDDNVLAKRPELSNDRNLLKRHLYSILSEIYGYKSPWGVLTGVRPVKVLHKLLEQGVTETEARDHFKNFFFVTDKKTDLCVETLKNQRGFIGVNENEVSFYVSIPFCPTICSYCTFGSSPIARYAKRVDEYIDLLCEEIGYSAEGLKGKKVTEIYVGGGTPSSVTAAQLDRILAALSRHFDPAGLSEFCVEAGRPDTVTAEKLDVIKARGVMRISINPQTMNDRTLENIGRHHTGRQTVEAFELARSKGFANINMDVIAGLPGENAEDFANTMEAIKKLGPDGLTVHSLALKRASRLTKDDEMKKLVLIGEAEKMCACGAKSAEEMGLRPFYLYRQKNCIGNNENVSYCRPGCESPYNIHIMEEDKTVIACGAGAVTKVVKEGGTVIERFFNTKSVDEYLTCRDETLRRKAAAFESLWS